KHENLDFVLGSRLYGRTRSLYSLLKEKFSYLGTLLTTYLINIMYGKKFSDIIGTRLYRKAVFKNIHVKSSTLIFDFEIVAKACKAGLKIKEVPVSYKPRTYKEGKKIRPSHLFPAIFTLFRVRVFDKD
ncbi:MAG: hypothetical protein NTW09_03280, partial [Candidatus Omnitrophica bacterium]|nr:hypothetical protein [Candidatus Omnitrophota bacterium]